MKVWHDDIRPAPKGWEWARTNSRAMELLAKHDVEEISLDHDLGLHTFTEEQIRDQPDLMFGRGQAEETGYDLVRWMCDTGNVPRYITVHSWNPDGARRMADHLRDAGHECQVRPFDFKETRA